MHWHGKLLSADGPIPQRDRQLQPDTNAYSGACAYTHANANAIANSNTHPGTADSYTHASSANSHAHSYALSHTGRAGQPMAGQ